MAVQRIEFEAIGTLWNIDLYDLDNQDILKISNLIKARIELFDKTYSRFRPDSLISEMGKISGTYRLPEDAKEMIDLYRRMFDATSGKVTPLIGQVLVDAGYDANYSLTPKPKISPAKLWSEVIEYNFPNITLKEPAVLDFGAIGKGYLIDIISNLLSQNGILNHVVEAGGDMISKSTNSTQIQVALEDPDNTENAIGIAEICNEALAGSATNRRKWHGFHHIIDPEIVKSPNHIKAVWVVAKTTTLADALSTALFFTKAEKLKQLFDFEYLILWQDKSASKSQGFKGNLFTN